ncbi:MAG: CotH kinase family protein [Bacteroidales bacterium]|nr:CotH kinase family protein [Bacteroidales bacterium]
MSDRHQDHEAFDGDPSTYVAGNNSRSWIGYDLKDTCVITKIRYASDTKVDSYTKMKGGWFEGANKADFGDAIPLYWITEEPVKGELYEAEVDISRGFRYVRFMGPFNDHTRIAEFQVFGRKNDKGNDDNLYSIANIPIISIKCEKGTDPYDKVNELGSIVTGLVPGGKYFTQDSAYVRLRGNWSFTTSPKKSYRIKFKESQKFFGSPAKAKKWTLIPNYGDKSLIRNQLSFDISERFGMAYTPFHQMVHLWVNGEYRGVYQLCDQVDIRKGRINIKEMDEADVEGEELTGGYFLEIDAYAGSEDWKFTSRGGIPVTIKSPDDPQVDAQKYYIQNHFNKMEALVLAGNYELEKGYQQYLHLPSFLKRHLHQEFVGNPDALWSCFMYKDRGNDTIYTGPVWDHDLAFDNDNRTHDNLTNSDYTGWLYTYGSRANGTLNFWNNILADPVAVHKMQGEWARLRCTKAVDKTELDDLIDDYSSLLGGVAQDMNFTRWDILNSEVHQNYTARGSYQAEVNYLKTYLDIRIPWMDTKLECETNTFELIMSDAKWATLYIPFAAKIPEGLTVYIVTDTQGRKLVKKEVSLIEPFTPYLVNGEAGSYTFSGYSVPDWDKQSMGILTGTSVEMQAIQDTYVMQKINEVVCFRKVAAVIPTIKPHRCYLELPHFVVEGAPERLLIDDEETNDLDFIETESHNGILRVYGLNGTLVYDGSTGDPDADNVLNTLPKGVYLVTMDGKEYKKIVRK